MERLYIQFKKGIKYAKKDEKEENKAGYTNRHRRVWLGRGSNVGGRGGMRSCILDNISVM